MSEFPIGADTKDKQDGFKYIASSIGLTVEEFAELYEFFSNERGQAPSPEQTEADLKRLSDILSSPSTLNTEN